MAQKKPTTAKKETKASGRAAAPSFSPKVNKKDPRKKVPFERAKFDLLKVHQTQEMSDNGEDDVYDAEQNGFVQVPEMSDPKRGVYIMIRPVEQGKQKMARVKDKAMTLIRRAVGGGVGINRAGVSVRENVAELVGGMRMQTSNAIGGSVDLPDLADVEDDD